MVWCSVPPSFPLMDSTAAVAPETRRRLRSQHKNPNNSNSNVYTCMPHETHPLAVWAGHHWRARINVCPIRLAEFCLWGGSGGADTNPLRCLHPPPWLPSTPTTFTASSIFITFLPPAPTPPLTPQPPQPPQPPQLSPPSFPSPQPPRHLRHIRALGGTWPTEKSIKGVPKL